MDFVVIYYFNMLPVLLDLKFVKIYTFGVFFVLAFFWGCYLLWRLIRLTSYKEEDIFDGLFFSLFGGLFFARIVHVILNFNKFGFNFFKFILINGYPGLSLYGGLIGGFLFLYLHCLIKKNKFLEIVDYFIPPLFLALAFGKLASFFSGVEVGTKTKLFLSIRYSGFDGLRHLTAFYESLAFFLALYLTNRIIFDIRKEKFSQGFNLSFFAWYFGLTYFVFDKIKAHHLYWLGYSFNRLLSIFLLLTFSFYFVYYFRSLIIDRLKSISNFIFNYGKKTYQKIYHSAKRKIGKRKDETEKTDRGVEKR